MKLSLKINNVPPYSNDELTQGVVEKLLADPADIRAQKEQCESR